MKLTREQKVWSTVLGLVLAALLGDRMFFSEPASASAGTAPITHTDTRRHAGQTPAAAAGTVAADEISIAARLKSTGAKLDSTSDPFALAGKWAAASNPAQVNTAELFKKSHSLGGVMISRNGTSRAIIDGRLVQVGQVVAGYKLTAVTTTSAAFTSGESTVVLMVPGFDGRIAE
jgi:hypothetical protein